MAIVTFLCACAQAFHNLKVLFKGSVTIPPADTEAGPTVFGQRFTSGNQVFRKIFALYANVRPARSWPGVPCVGGPGVDVVVVRENTEDVYTGEERWVTPDTAECIKRTTRPAARRVAEFAARLGATRAAARGAGGRARVTVVHKANVCKLTDGLFLREATAAGRATAAAAGAGAAGARVDFDDMLADAACTRLVTHPREFDVLLCPNLFGDLLSNLAGGVVGSLGVCGSANYGDGHALFEPAHGSAPDIAGAGVANPMSQVISGAMLCEHIGQGAAGRAAVAAMERALAAGVRTRDVGGGASTEEFVSEVLAQLRAAPPTPE